jgi:starch phosphorylase
MYYGRNGAGYSPEWVQRSKRAMMTVIPRFDMRRVLFDYRHGLYQPAARQYRRLSADGFAGASRLADWKQRVRQAWPKVSLKLLSEIAPELPRGGRLNVRVAAGLNGLQPSDVRVEFVGRRLLPEVDLSPPPLSSFGQPPREGVWSMILEATEVQGPDGMHQFTLDAELRDCGQFAIEVRIYPWHELLTHPFELGLMKWL